PSYSTHLVEPLSGWSKRRRCVFQVPKWKSKSCWPSRAAGTAFGDSSFAIPEASKGKIVTAAHRGKISVRRNLIRASCPGERASKSWGNLAASPPTPKARRQGTSRGERCADG